MRIRNNLYKILHSYLENRKQKDWMDDYISDFKDVNLGVPQNSILGPLLFLVYINDLPNICNISNFYLFADYTPIIVKDLSYSGLQNKINMLIPKLTEWFLSNRFTLNASKTYYQLYSFCSNSDNIDIKIDNFEIKRAPVVKYLGILVDEKLKFESHINCMTAKLSRNIGLMSKYRYFLSSRELLLLYNSFVLPYISYCAAVWGSNNANHSQKFVKLQKELFA